MVRRLASSGEWAEVPPTLDNDSNRDANLPKVLEVRPKLVASEDFPHALHLTEFITINTS